MKKILCILIITISALSLRAQSLVIDSTRFITGIHQGVIIEYAIPTSDKGILFVGYDYDNPGGIIPYFFDTTINGNVLIGKIDSNRAISWIKIYGGSQGDGAVGACQAPDGGYAVLAGTGSDDGDVTGYKGNGDIWLLRIDPLGNLLWEKTYGSSSQDGPLSIANTPDHGFILLGVTYGSDGDVPFHYGDWTTDDWLVVKTDSAGNKQWSKDLGGTGDEYLMGSILSVGSNYYLVGASSSEDHDCTDTSWHPNVFTGYDYYILKLDTTGTVLWDSSYGGNSDDDMNYAMFDARDSSIVMIGTTSSSYYMVTGYHGCDIGDMWVVKANISGELLWEKTLGSIQQETGKSICESSNGGYIAYGNTQGYHCHDSTIDNIGYVNCWLFNLDSSGATLNNKIFGGTDAEYPYSIVADLNGYAAFGLSGSKVFTEGTTYGNFDSIGGPFVSYIDSGILSVNNLLAPVYIMSAYPNPAHDNVNILIPYNTGRLTIINSIGQQVYANEVSTTLHTTDISISKWSVGVYLIIWQGEDGELLTTTLIKN